jgi:hypothetical protein
MAAIKAAEKETTTTKGTTIDYRKSSMNFANLFSYNMLIESFGIDRGLLESIKIAKDIEAILTKHDLVVPADAGDMDEVDINSDDLNTLKVRTRGKIQPVRIGRVLQRLFPNKLDTVKVNQITADIQKLLNPFEFKIEDDVTDAYCKYNIASCMNGDRRHITKFYDTQKPNLKVVILYKLGAPMGRALLWSKVDGAKNGMFMDRIYPAHDEKVIKLMREYAIKNDWSYKNNQTAGEYTAIANGRSNLSYECVNVDKIELVPYMDTFVWGDHQGHLSNIDFNDADNKFENVNGARFLGSNIDKFRAYDDGSDDYEDDVDDDDVNEATPASIGRAFCDAIENDDDDVISAMIQQYDPHEFIALDIYQSMKYSEKTKTLKIVIGVLSFSQMANILRLILRENNIAMLRDFIKCGVKLISHGALCASISNLAVNNQTGEAILNYYKAHPSTEPADYMLDLRTACELGRLDIVKFLTKYMGVEYLQSDIVKLSHLIYTTLDRHHLELAEWFIENYDISKTSIFGFMLPQYPNLFKKAMERGSFSCERTFEHPTDMMTSPLYCAMQNGNPELIQWIIDNFSDKYAKLGDGMESELKSIIIHRSLLYQADPGSQISKNIEYVKKFLKR